MPGGASAASGSLLEKTGDETDWVKRKEIYQHIFKHEEELWFKMEKKPLKDKHSLKRCVLPSCLLLHPHPTNPTPPHSIPLFRHMLRSSSCARGRWVWPSSTTQGQKARRARDQTTSL